MTINETKATAIEGDEVLDECDHVEPVATEDDYDESGYDPSDDAPSDPVEGRPQTGASGGPSRYPVAPAQIPDWVKAFGNGRVPEDRMIKVAPIREGWLVPEAAASWRSLQNAARDAGWNITMTGAYRTYERQHAMFFERFQDTDSGTGTAKTFEGRTYWLKSGKALAATPGNSNHGWGCAVDMALDGYGGAARSVSSNPAFMSWVVDNAHIHGWSWEVQSEPWHLRLVGSPSIPAPDGSVGDTGTAPNMAPPLPTLRKGSRGGQVAWLQTICMAAHWGELKAADGDFGPKTEAAVMAMQSFFNVTVDGVYGNQSHGALLALFSGHQ